MKLNEAPFLSVKNGEKKVDVRLYDEKRKKVKVGDTIEFSNSSDSKEKLIVEVEKIRRYPTYELLVEDVELADFGGTYVSKQQLLKRSLSNIYSKDEQEKYGFVLFNIKLLSVSE